MHKFAVFRMAILHGTSFGTAGLLSLQFGRGHSGRSRAKREHATSRAKRGTSSWEKNSTRLERARLERQAWSPKLRNCASGRGPALKPGARKPAR